MRPLSRPWLWIGILLLLVIAGIADYSTGPDLGFSFMYLGPVTVAAWFVGLSAALGISLASAAIIQLADSLWRTHAGLSLSPWVGTTHLVAFAFVAFVVQRLRDHQERLASLNQELAESLHREKNLARTDPLTGLLNSRAFLEELGREQARSLRTRLPITVAYIDLDDFKRVNDFRGHAAGDELLRQVGTLLSETLRQGDVAARLGGDEFGVILHGIEAEEAQWTARRIVEGIVTLTEAHFTPALGASIGLVTPAPDSTDSVEDLLRHADGAMYEGKARGKGKVVIGQPRPKDDLTPRLSLPERDLPEEQRPS